ncbi:MAG: hypothetical protein HZA80_01750 [Candidatus Taylorbacteria bacterium]|nr:hypothetical protein [Candidatus Taylorbacteria bacterium]
MKPASPLCVQAFTKPGQSRRIRNAAAAQMSPLRRALHKQHLGYFNPATLHDHKCAQYARLLNEYIRAKVPLIKGFGDWIFLGTLLVCSLTLGYNGYFLWSLGFLSIMTLTLWSSYTSRQKAAYREFVRLYNWQEASLYRSRCFACPRVDELIESLENYFEVHCPTAVMRIEFLGPDPILWVMDHETHEKYAIAAWKDPNDPTPIIARVW